MSTRSFIALLLVSSSFANAQVAVDWNQPVVGLSIALDQDNNVFTVNYDANLGGDITLIKRNSDGVELWQAAYDQTSTTRFDRATWVATDQQGNAIVAGTVMSGFGNPVNANALVMKFDTAGVFQWRVEYENDFDGSSTRKCLVDRANNIYVVGLGMGPNGLVTQVKKFASDGTPVWSWFDPDGIGGPVNIKFTPDSNLVISARAQVGSINGYAKIDRDGNSIWSLPGVTSQTIGDAAGDAAGNTFCVHGTQGGSVIRKLSPTGAELWQNTYAITAYRVEVASDGGPVVSGFPAGGGGGAAFLKADASGTQLWSNPDADGPNIFLLHAQMLLDADDNAYLCAGILFNMGVCKVNSDGSGAWYITAGNGNAQGFALGTDNNVYVTGGSTLRLGQGLPTAITDYPEPGRAIRVFPVPAHDRVQVEWNGHIPVRWRIRSVSGPVMAEGPMAGTFVDVSSLPSGVFILKVTDAMGRAGHVRLLKQ